MGRPSPSQAGRPGGSLARDVGALIFKVALILAAFFLLATFIFGFVRMPDDAMAPSIKDGDLVLCYRLDRDYAAGDAVCLDTADGARVARVVAVGGDEVDLDGQGLVVNGDHPLDAQAQGPTLPAEGGIAFPTRVPEGSVFLLSDNREEGHDSRTLGCVAADDTMGEAVGLFRRRGL